MTRNRFDLADRFADSTTPGRRPLDFSPRIPPKVENWPPIPRAPRSRPQGEAGVRAAYAVVAALAAGMVFWTWTDGSRFGDVQALSQIAWGLALTGLGISASFGLCRISFVRHGCTVVGLWAALSPLFLPGPMSYVVVVVGIVLFLAAGCAAEDWEHIQEWNSRRMRISASRRWIV